MRIAMWSGPRNLSTAMMYSFGARADCAVVDEPFYAAYLKMTGIEHPMGDQVMASQPQDPAEVARSLLEPISAGKPHFYQKHMCQHMIPGVPRGWMREVTNVFLIRHPARVIASFGAKYENPTLADMGFTQQTELFEEVCQFGTPPVVVDSDDIRRDPAGMLQRLCAAIDLPWDDGMLGWPTGGHPADGVWAAHWYGAVHRSTTFAAPDPNVPELTGAAADLLAEALPHYQRLAEIRLG